MFLLVNEFGNVYKEVKSEREKNELLKLGYKEVSVERKVEKTERTVKTQKKTTTSKGVNKK